MNNLRDCGFIPQPQPLKTKKKRLIIIGSLTSATYLSQNARDNYRGFYGL
jgi:hypothetical protein